VHAGLASDKAQLQAAADALAALDEVTYLIASTGRYDYLAESLPEQQAPARLHARRLAQVPGAGQRVVRIPVRAKESYRTSPSAHS
jgi:hypothetical protein